MSKAKFEGQANVIELWNAFIAQGFPQLADDLLLQQRSVSSGEAARYQGNSGFQALDGTVVVYVRELHNSLRLEAVEELAEDLRVHEVP